MAMSKYICICGKDFKTKKGAEHHGGLDGDFHFIIKKLWRARLLDFLISSRKYWKILGFIIMYLTIVYHFGIHFNVWEGLFMGIGMGLAIE
jgi:hypothetical protein